MKNITKAEQPLSIKKQNFQNNLYNRIDQENIFIDNVEECWKDIC